MRSKTTLITVLSLLLFASAGAVPPQSSSGTATYDSLKAEAEQYYAEKSFSRAREVYQRLSTRELAPAQRRWVEVRLADTKWRAVGTRGDSVTIEAARAELQDFIRKTPADGHDLAWAEANESLGDLHLAVNRYDLQPAVPYYVAALDWWAGQDDLALARRRYLSMVWKVALDNQTWAVPREILVNAVKIAEAPADRARARYLLATQLVQEGRPESIERGIELLDEVIAMGRTTEWLDDALFLAGTTLSQDRAVLATADPSEPRSNYKKALEYFRRLVAEFKATESRYHDNAQRLIEQIVGPQLNVRVPGTFLPDIDQSVVLTWRNVRRVQLALYSVDLTRDVVYDSNRNWLESISTEGRSAVRTWTHDTGDVGDHRPGFSEIRISPRLPQGAYVISADSDEAKMARSLLLVTDAHILVHGGRERMQVLVSNVMTGEPIANARVRIVETERKARESVAQTNANGMAEFKISGGGNVFVTAAAGSRQAFHQTWNYYYSPRDPREWRIYAFTDRPAYRPEETVQWKILARERDDERWRTPAGQTLTYEIHSPRGEKVASGTAKLNDFGSFWGELGLTKSMPLGAYAITFRSASNDVGSAQLFRLEEYKLPEFVVKVSTPEGKQYRLGETIEATIDASYYFGGPVANAEIDVVVYQSAFHRYWTPWREYDWYWRGWMPHHSESQVLQEKLRTDANGRAVLNIPTTRDAADTRYRIEARVVDASRREVRGEGIVRVTKQRYSVLASPEHYVHRPGEIASVKFKAVDANDRPIRTTGTVNVVQRRWRVDVALGSRYVEEDVLETKLTTDEQGEATLRFTPKSTGYYAIRWTSVDGDPRRAQDLVTAETTIWVADPSSVDIGYHASGMQLIIDKESMRVGQTANVLIVAPTSGRWVALTTFGDDILDTQVLRLDGTVKLARIPIDDRHVPNFFITSSSVFDRQLATQTERVVVPPVEHFLDVEVKSDRQEYEPRQEGTLTVTTRDASGKPIAAEVAVSVSDEAVTAIQEDLAGDPRQFFYGDLREIRPQVTAGVHTQRYISREEMERREKEQLQERDGSSRRLTAQVGAAVGARNEMAIADAVQEAITVTAQAPMAMPVPAPPPPPAAEPAPVVGGAAAGNIAVEVRTDFRSTAFWKPDVLTDASGTATVKVKFPEALTTWRATARAATTGSAFGKASSTSRTNLPLIARLQAPRFFVVGDEVTVSAVFNNNTDAAVTVTPSIDVQGLTLRDASAAPLNVPARGEARADWTVLAETSGTAKLRVTGKSSTHGDAMEKSILVYEHGIDKLIARSGKLRGSEAVIHLDLPRARRSTELTVQVAPSLAVTMLDALPYLINFPYGCTEQTMSRFLPAAIVARTLENLGLGRSHISGKPLDDVTTAGMARLYDMQHPDGSWGWWKEGDGDDFMTAYVAWGFAIARDGGLKVNESAVERAVEWMQTRLPRRENQWSDQAWMLHALSAWRKTPTAAERRAYDNVWKNREKLTAYSRALLALTAHRYGDAERANVLVRNLEDGVIVDSQPDQSVLLKGETAAETMATAHWGAQRFWWRWYEGPVETTAFVLQALVSIDPDHRLVEPAMNWLVKNRRGAQWSNTRDTAIVILAMNDYLKRSGELKGDVSYELTVNGKVVAVRRIAAADVLKAPSRFSVNHADITDGLQEILIRRTGGTAPLYFAAEARFFSLEEPVKAAGNEIFVHRQYFRLKPRPTLLKGMLYDRLPLNDGESVASGERIDVVLTVESKNDYEYLMFEDLKPAGFEAIALQSGQPMYATNTRTKHSAWVYQELRDRKVAMFIDRLPQGVWEMTYTLRAETPGSFHALPLLGQAMYVPDIRANGDEVRVRVTE